MLCYVYMITTTTFQQRDNGIRLECHFMSLAFSSCVGITSEFDLRSLNTDYDHDEYISTLIRKLNAP